MEVALTRQSLVIRIKHLHDVGDARRQAIHAAQTIGFDETQVGRVGIIATELAGNLAKHAGKGDLILRAIAHPAGGGLELMSLDNGPGMNVPLCMEDGYSTAGSPGTGLGAINRLASSFDSYSLASTGTVIVARVMTPGIKPQVYDIGAVCLPIEGENYCGDAWATSEDDRGISFIVSDGLGHGIGAAEASEQALALFTRRPDLSPPLLLEAQHAALRSTRGAAVLVGRLDDGMSNLTCAGIGNVAGFILANAKTRGLVSMNGIVGHQVHKIKSFDYACEPNDTIILHSDGLTNRWKLEEFPGLLSRSAGVIAGMIYKTYKRGKDDATVLVVRRP